MSGLHNKKDVLVNHGGVKPGLLYEIMSSQLASQWMIRLEGQILVRVGRFSID